MDDDLGCASYLIGDEAAGAAVVVDPAYAIEPYLDEAERSGVRIVRVLETPLPTGAAASGQLLPAPAPAPGKAGERLPAPRPAESDKLPAADTGPATP